MVQMIQGEYYKGLMDGFRIKHLKQDIIGTHLNQNQKKEVNQGDTENRTENRIENQGVGDKWIL
jgi:hypothetical protein